MKLKVEYGYFHVYLTQLYIDIMYFLQLELVGECGEMNWESATEAIKTVINMISSPSLQVAKLAQNVIFNICK